MTTKQQLVKKIMRPLRLIWIGLFVFILLFLLSYFILKIPAVQNYVADKTTQIISDKLGTKVSIDRVDLNIFKGVEIEKFYVEDLSGDTLIYAGSFYSDFYNSVKSFYTKSFLVKSMRLENGTVNLSRTVEDPVYNYVRLFNKEYDPFFLDTVASSTNKAKEILKSINESRNRTKVNFSIDNVVLKNFHFKNEDFAFGNSQRAWINELSSSFDTFDIQKMRFAMSDLTVSGLDFTQNKFTPDSTFIFPSKLGKEIIFNVSVNNFNGSDINGSIVDSRNGNNVDYNVRVFNPKNIELSSVDLKAEAIKISEPYYIEGRLSSLTGKSGALEINEFSASRFYLDKRKAGFEELVLKTPKSTVRDNLFFSFRKMEDWKDFINKVLVNGTLDNTSIAVTDLMYFAPKLRTNRFFSENMEESIILSGKITGRVNSFNARNFKAEITNNLKFQGSFIARDITTPDESLLNIGFSSLNTNVTTLNKLIPGFKVPTNFYKLNNLDFSGRFDGYYQDFVAYGDLLTDLGRADVDMRLNLKEGSKNASYSGKINLYDFDLNTWSERKDFGNLSFSAIVENGRGLELSTAYAELGGELIALDYRGYNYTGIVDAKLEQNLFDGKFSINDDNIDLDFEGNIDLTGEIPQYDFGAGIDKLNLQALNFSKDITHIEGIVDIKAKGSSIDDIIGSALGNQIVIVKDLDTLDFGHLAIASTLSPLLERTIFIDSDIGNAEVNGQYKLTELPDAFIDLLKSNYPDFTKNLKYLEGVPKEDVTATFDVEITEASNLLRFFTYQTADLDSLVANGMIDYTSGKFELTLRSPDARYSDYAARQLDANLTLGESQGTFYLKADSAFIKQAVINDLSANGRVTNDSIHFDIIADKALDSIDNIAISGEFFPKVDEVELQFSNLEFDLFGSNWTLSRNNSAQLGKQKVKLENFILQDDQRRIGIRSINENKGVEAKFTDVQFSLLNQFIANEDLILSGNTNATISFDNIFEQTGIFVKAEVERVKVKEQKMGTLYVTATTDLSRNQVEYNVTLDNKKDKVILNGNYGLESKLVNAQLDVDGFPLNFLENFLGGNIRNTQGLIYGQIDIDGLLNDLDTRGNGEIVDGYTEIDYLGTKYSFEQANFKIRKNFVDFTGAKLVDSRSQIAILDGGLTHQNFRSLGLKLDISSDKFILLNTSGEDNPSYYGFGQGEADVSFRGKFSEMLISIMAITGEETTMTLPISYVNSARDQSFLPIMTKEEFVLSIEDEKVDINQNYYVGLTLELFLTVTPEAEMKIVFDPATGHQLAGRGSGDIQLFLSPNGDIDMYGGYNVESGNYDFALESLIKKEFQIKEGGIVTWSGDPLDAKIDIAAEYKTLRAPLDVFLAEYLGGNEDLLSRASEETDVQLTVNLLDQLLNPTIKFQIDFPNLGGDLSGLVKNKLDILQEDPLILNNQVLGLLIFNNFLPYNNPIATFSNSSVNSSLGVIVGELLSAQLSGYVSSLMESILDENGLIYDVDVDVRLDLDNATTTSNSGYGLTLKPKFNTDKFDIVLGGDYLTQNANEQVPYTTGDFIFDYYLTEDKKIKIRVYGRTDRQVFEGRRQRVGAGLYFRREFSNFRDLRKSFTKVAEEIKKKEQYEQE